MEIAIKTCTVCKEPKPIIAFARRSRAKDKLQSRCRACQSVLRKAWHKKTGYKWQPPRRTFEQRRDDYLKSSYGITSQDYNRMLEAQGNHCAICPETNPTPRKGRYFGFNVDHCHKTGRVRGLLCNFCNNGLGFFRDDPVNLKAAIAYLEQFLN